ncbi:MAG: hypothetical protein DI556_03800 [Rhodovulum sulfidophilum]|uniref:Uncharacterized protein n=1 Tax=Rhodovulum sulfidophilum TaxID=35806 RepID=A0A2W5NDU6_RHOSU|nr:MAG: hypothetical protein DI556_03800 [Rhodovulum sulfidophilum]
MFKHSIDICPDNTEELARRLDSLTETGAEIVQVVWQPRRVEREDQAGAFDTSGSFAIIWRSNAMLDAVALDERSRPEETAFVA